jgi:hypothetical protein
MHKARSNEARISIEIVSVIGPSFGWAKYWLMIKENLTDYIWSYFLHNKSDLSDTVMTWMWDLKKRIGITVNHICWDNAGESQALQKWLIEDPELSAVFENVAAILSENL